MAKSQKRALADCCHGAHHERAAIRDACGACAKSDDCPPALRTLCSCLAELASHPGEIHSTVSACRDMASRCGVDACKQGGKRWKQRSNCCFRMCDACDRFCHQRCALPDALATQLPMLCAFKTGPKIPGTRAYVPPTKLDFAAVVYCASTSCSAGPAYCHKAGTPCREYPGGLLEFACRCKCDPSLPQLSDADMKKCFEMSFNTCGHGPYACYP